MSDQHPGERNLALIALALLAAIWGSTFFQIKDVQTRIPSADMMTLRWTMAAITLTVFTVRQWLRMRRSTFYKGMVLGVLFGAAQIAQNGALDHTPASVSGFLTGLYVVLTPVLIAVVFRARLSWLTWCAVGLATVGLGVLSLNGLSIGFGEAITLLSALFYAIHIITMGRWGTRDNTLQLAVVQAWVTAIVCFFVALPDGIVIPATAFDWSRVAYLAIIAGAGTILLQTWAQARVDATRAAVLMSAEPVWAATFAVVLGGEQLTARMVVGGLAIVSAMYLIELGPRLINRREPERQAA